MVKVKGQGQGPQTKSRMPHATQRSSGGGKHPKSFIHLHEQEVKQTAH
jgi:hypothetical protein